MKNTIIILSILCSIQLSAQDMVLGLYNLKDPNYTFNEAQRNNVSSKIKGMLTEQNVTSATAEAAIGLVPELLLNEPQTVAAGMKNVTVYNGDLVITVQQKDGKQVFGVFRKKVSGSGTSASLAISNLVNNLSTSDTRFGEFLKTIQPKINDFYAKNCVTLMADADRLINAGQMDAGISILLNIPSAVPCRAEADGKLKTAYARYRDFVCKQSLTRAKAAAAAKDYSTAVGYLKYIDPESNCYAEVNTFIAEMQTNADSDMKAQLDTVKEYFKALANQQNWQVLLMRDYMNQSN